MTGFKITEIMTGTHQLNTDHINRFSKKDLRLSFKIDWSHKDVLECIKSFVSKESVQFSVEGRFFAEGLFQDTRCRGFMFVDYFNSHNIMYRLEIHNPKTGLYDHVFVGDKLNIQLWNLLISHTTCSGIIMKTDLESCEVISKCKVFFDMKTLPAMLISFSWL